MALFQQSVLKKYLNAQDDQKISEAFSKFSYYFLNPAIQTNIKTAKEEQFQEGFLRELFVNSLGYTLNPAPNFNLTTELKNIQNSKKADGAILKNGKAVGVIELKSTHTHNLDKITDQAFGYKNNQPECVYVITSNFEKLRFFIDDATEHLEFNLFTLNQNDFQRLYFCLHAQNLLANLPQQAKNESIVTEIQITQKLYQDYSAFKNDLWLNLKKNSPQTNELLLYKKNPKTDRSVLIYPIW